MAAQLTATNFRARRGLVWWMQPAASSLPVPVSPTSSTFACDWPAFSSSRKVCSMAGLAPIRLPSL